MAEREAGWLRTRQSNVVGGREYRHVVKLTAEQEMAVQAAARVQGVTVARLLADSALKAPRASVSREDLTELFAVTKLIAAVGLRPADRMLGAGFGLVRGVLLLLAVTVVVGMTPLHTSAWWTEATGPHITGAALKGLKPLLPQDFGKYLPE